MPHLRPPSGRRIKGNREDAQPEVLRGTIRSLRHTPSRREVRAHLPAIPAAFDHPGGSREASCGSISRGAVSLPALLRRSTHRSEEAGRRPAAQQCRRAPVGLQHTRTMAGGPGGSPAQGRQRPRVGVLGRQGRARGNARKPGPAVRAARGGYGPWTGRAASPQFSRFGPNTNDKCIVIPAVVDRNP